MSYPYPQDRHRDRKEKGDQPYKDATESYTQTEADLERKAGGEDPRRDDRDETERIEDLEREVEERLDEAREQTDDSER